MSKKRKGYFKPGNLDLELLLETNPPSFKYDKWFFYHYINLIVQIPARNKDIRENVDLYQGYTPIDAGILQGIKHNYANYREYLVENEVIKVKNFRKGLHAALHAFTEQYRNQPLIPVEVDIPFVVFNSYTQERINYKSKIKYQHQFQNYESGLLQMSNEAQDYISNYFQTSTDANKEHKYYNYISTYRDFTTNDILYKVDPKGMRLHTNLANASKNLRYTITYDGRPLASTDLKNSQPYLLIKPVLNYLINFDQISGNTNHKEVKGILLSPLDMEKVKYILRQPMYKDLEHYIKDVTSGNYYDSLLVDYNNLPGNKLEGRDQLKKECLLAFYSSPKYNSKMTRLLKQKFPTVSNVIKQLKTINILNLKKEYKTNKYSGKVSEKHSQLPLLMQRLEASIFLDQICPAILAKYPTSVHFTIHDNIITNDYEFSVTCVEPLMKEIIEKNIGFKCTLDTQSWDQKPGQFECK